MKKRFFILSMLASVVAFGQTPGKNIQDTATLAHAIRQRSKVDHHERLYYMSTNTEKDLSDYYALAFGGGLKYPTGVYKGFQLTKSISIILTLY